MDLSLVIPVKEEEENLPELMKEIVEAITPTGKSFEVIVIDDGSRDRSWEVLVELSKKYDFLRLFRFQFNCGKADALSLGFSKARGELIATLDGDLQDDPHEIPKMMKILDDGYDLVSGWKVHRHDPWHKTWPSKLFNLTVSVVCGKRLHDFNCGIKLYRSSVVRFIRGFSPFHSGDGKVARRPCHGNAGDASRPCPRFLQVRRFPLGLGLPRFADFAVPEQICDKAAALFWTLWTDLLALWSGCLWVLWGGMAANGSFAFAPVDRGGRLLAADGHSTLLARFFGGTF